MQISGEQLLARRLSYKSSVMKMSLQSNSDQDDSKQFQTLFTPLQHKNWKLTTIYQTHIQKLNNKSLIIIGACLPLKYLKALYTLLSGKNIENQSQLITKKQITFSSGLDKDFQGCNIILWVYPLDTTNLPSNILSIFWSYPEIIFTTEQLFNQTCTNALSKTTSCSLLEKIKNKQKPKIAFMKDIIEDKSPKQKLQQQLFICFKKNPLRLRNQHNIINIFLINSILAYSREGQTSAIALSPLLNLQQRNRSITPSTITESAIVNYLSESIQKQYDEFIEKLLLKLPFRNKKLITQIELFQQNIITEIVSNLSLLISSERVEQFVIQVEARVESMKQEVIHKNKLLYLEKNNNTIEKLFSGFLNNFERKKYFKDNVQQLTTDFQTLLEQYDHEQISQDETFEVFNDYMLKNKVKLYRKISNLEEQEAYEYQKKRKNFQDNQQELKEKILLKKQMLQTLEKQVKSLETNKSNIQLENEKMKKLWISLDANLIFDRKQKNKKSENSKSEVESSEIQEEAESIKIIKIRKDLENDANNINKIERNPQNKGNSNSKSKKKNKWCCECSIF